MTDRQKPITGIPPSSRGCPAFKRAISTTFGDKSKVERTAVVQIHGHWMRHGSQQGIVDHAEPWREVLLRVLKFYLTFEMRELADRYGINPKTDAKWRRSPNIDALRDRQRQVQPRESEPGRLEKKRKILDSVERDQRGSWGMRIR